MIDISDKIEGLIKQLQDIQAQADLMSIAADNDHHDIPRRTVGHIAESLYVTASSALGTLENALGAETPPFIPVRSPEDAIKEVHG